MKRAIVAGSRTVKDREYVFRILRWHLTVGDTVLCGMCDEGVDALAVEFINECEEYKLTLEPHRADWEQYRKAAGPIRNRDMARSSPNKLVAIWDGKSTGTRDMINQALVHGIEVHVYQYKKDWADEWQ